MKARIAPLLVFGLVFASANALAQADAPSRAPVKGCAWEKLADASIGLAAWVQRCDFGFRRIEFLFDAGALAYRIDGGRPDPLIEVFDLQAGETPRDGIRRVFLAHTAPALASRCVLEPYRGSNAPGSAQRYTFVPDAAYARELKKAARPDEVGDPPCGEWGDAPDGIQYFEAHPSAKVRKVLFVRVGQDEPLYDENTLRLIDREGR